MPAVGPRPGRSGAGVDQPTQPVPRLDQPVPGAPGRGAAFAGTVEPPVAGRRGPARGPERGTFSDTGEAPAFPPSGETAAYPVPGERPARWSGDDGYGDGGDDDGYGDDGYGDDDYYDDEYDEPDDDDLPQRRGCRRALVVLAVLAVLTLVTSWVAWSWVQGRIDPAGPPGDEVMIEIPEGTSTAGIGRVLADAGVISDATVWSWYTKLRSVPSIQAGSYRMRLNSSFPEAIDDLSVDPLPPDMALVTIPEGLTQAQIVERLADPESGVPGFTVEAVQAAMADPSVRPPILPADKPLEGVLFPETYAYEEGDTELDLVKRMVDEFQEVAGEVDLEARAAALGRTPYEILTIASMVEREAGIPEDGPKVARVIYNRLAVDEPLGIDATSCYEKGEIPCQLTTAELEDNTPYDTRRQRGLPPTPIASPGRASIEAALAPTEGDWFYYVLDAEKNDGSSFFTASQAEFEEAVQRCKEAGLGCG